MVYKLMGLWLFFDALVAAIIITANGTDTIITCHYFLLSPLFYCNQTKMESKKIFQFSYLLHNLLLCRRRRDDDSA